jgi:hypothetical protein
MHRSKQHQLQRTAEAIVVATGALRERGCPPWVVEARASERHEQEVLLGPMCRASPSTCACQPSGTPVATRSLGRDHAKPSELPVMEATKFEFVINLKTANLLNIKISGDLLSLADEVIE